LVWFRFVDHLGAACLQAAESQRLPPPPKGMVAAQSKTPGGIRHGFPGIPHKRQQSAGTAIPLLPTDSCLGRARILVVRSMLSRIIAPYQWQHRSLGGLEGLRISLVLTFFWFLLWRTANSPPKEQDFPIGHVISYEGKWVDQRCKCTIEQGQAVWINSAIVTQSPASRRSRLTIRFAATGEAEEFDCTRVDCAEPLDVRGRLPKTKQASPIVTFLHAALAVIVDAYAEGGDQRVTLSNYARTSSRGASPIHIADAIVSFRGGNADLSAIFADVVAGMYLIDWCPVSITGKSICQDLPMPSEVRWNGHEALLTSVSIRPSLYEFFLCKKEGDRIFRGQSAFVLVTKSSDEANQMRTTYQEFLGLMKGWNGREASMLGHAYLQNLNHAVNR